MVIREMSREECLRELAAARWARLACAHENQPFIIPVHLAYDAATRCLYGFTTLGQKVEWMRTNPLVCIEVDEIAADDQWVSIIAFGRYEELPGTAGSDGAHLRAQERSRQVGEAVRTWPSDSGHRQCDDERERAWQALKTNRPVWWEPGCTAWATRAHSDSAEALILVYYKIRIDRVTGRKATRDARYGKSCAGLAHRLRDRVGRLLPRTLPRVFGGRAKP